jgi:hypothetical protein
MSAQHDIGRLERDVRQLQKTVHAFAHDDVFTQLLKFIHQPGWTTPAEFLLVHSAVTAMNAQVRELTTLRDAVLGASREIAQAGERVSVPG